MWKKRKNKVFRKKKYRRGHKSNGRNYDNPVYKQWRKDVAVRDNRTCQYPGCCSKKSLQIHHILSWSKYPALRFNVQNGITLCKKHHDMIWGREDDFIKIFHNILLRKLKDSQDD